MWTEEHRAMYKRPAGRSPSRMTDAEWAVLKPLIPPASPGGRPRKTDMREAMDAILFVLRTGCTWRTLDEPCFPPRSTVYNIFRKFQKDENLAGTLTAFVSLAAIQLGIRRLARR